MEIIQRALGLLSPILKRLWPWLIFAVGTKQLVQFYLSFVTDPHNDTDRILVALIMMCLQAGFAIMTGVFVMIAARDHTQGTRSLLWATFFSNFKYLTIESLRTILPILLRTLLLIIPGIIEYLRLSMVLFIVMLDEDYKKGQVDALERSRELTKGNLGFVFVFFVISSLFELGGTLVDTVKLTAQPYYYCVAFFLAVLGTAYSNVLFYCVYEKLSGKKGRSIS